MKHLLTVISMLLFFVNSYGQSFEGKLVYTVDFHMDEERVGQMGVTKEMIIDKMKSEGEFFDTISYFIKGGNYVKIENSPKQKRFVYTSKGNKIYLFEKDSEYVMIIDGEKPGILNMNLDYSKMQISTPDSVKTIQGDTCKVVKLTWGNLSDEYHWYNPSKVKMDPVLYEGHNYEYLNEILAITKAFPLEVTKSVGEFMTITMTIVEIEAQGLEEDMFQIPDLKESKRKEDKYVEKMTGNKVMMLKP